MGETPPGLGPITRADVPDVAAFLHRELDPRLSAQEWAAAIVPPWAGDAPNHGFHLRRDGEVVGVGLAFYSEREISGERRRFCNLGAWCVLDAERAHGLRLLRALLGQRGFDFTDLSPSGNVVGLNERLRFTHLDTRQSLVVNVALPSPGVRTIGDVEAMAPLLNDASRQILADHRGAAAARHTALVGPDRVVHVVHRRDRRKGVRAFATLLHSSHPDLTPLEWRALSRHLLFDGSPATLAERRIVSTVPTRAVSVRNPRPRMFRSTDLGPAQIDYLYSELTCVPW